MDTRDHAVPARHAATVAVVRDGQRGLETLLLKRTPKASFVGGAHVFPGGALDDSDEALAALLVGDEGQTGPWAAHVACALRECFEEAGLLFAADEVRADVATRWRARLHAGDDFASLLGGVRLDAGGVVSWSRWVTPIGSPKRFDTRFFVAAAPPGQQASPDGSEIVDCEWVAPSEALGRAEAGEMLLIPPTRSTLVVLTGFVSVSDVLAHARRTRVPGAVATPHR